MGKSGDPEGEASTTLNTTLSKPKDPKMQAAKVHMLNGTTKDFELHRGSDGDVLFTMASIDLSIEEREYFSLCFYDDQDLRHWLYNDKKILRQLKGLPWEFSFEVKFYPTAPATLNDDNARCTLFLQLRKDVASGRLPATIPTLALLGALVAQAEYGDADSTAEYERYLRDSLKVPNLKDQTQLNELLEKVKELHREQKGLTASEAESKYLDACKQLSMYGVFIFDAKDNDNNKVGIGICATGINIYKETIRVHRFAWQNIVKISYKKNSFSIKLKAGEMDKKETTLHYKVHDYLHAKRVWKCGVEHHTFFRLIQPEDKPKGGLFRWGSTRFRYQGRTQFQTKMASQMFDQSQGGTVPRAASARLTQSCDHGLNKENIPVHDKSTTLGRDGQPESPVTSPGVSYEISSAKRAGTTNGKVGTALDGDELVYTPVESPTSAAYYLSERSSLRSPYSSGAVSPNDWSAWGRDVSWRQTTTARRNLFGRQNDSSVHLLRIVKFGDEQPGVTSTARSADLEQIPIQQSVALYHRGFYIEPPREPTVRIQHYAPRNGHHPVERLQPLGEMEQHPIRFFVNLHHSGMTDRVRISRVRHSGVEEVADAVPENYVFPVHETSHTHILPRNPDLPPQCLLEHVDVYYDGDASTPPKMQKYRLVARVMPQLRPAASPPTVNGHQVQTYQAIQQRPYRGPLETTDRRDNLANLPLENQPRVRYVSKSTKAVAATVTSGEPIEEPQRVRYIARIRHEGAEEIVEKDQVQPQLYGLPSTSYEGPLEDTSRQDDLELLPIEDHAKIYHSGQSWIKAKPPTPVKEHPEPKEAKKKAILHVKGTEAEEEKPQIRVLARIQPSEVNEETVREPSPGLFGFLKTTGRKTRTVSNESSTIAAYPSSSEAYQGPLDTVDRREDLARLPLEQQPRVPYVSSPTKPIKEVAPEPVEEVRNVRYIARIRHEGEEETVEKDQVKPELYGLPSTSYEGPLEDTSRQDDLQHLPIQDHAEIYHSGQSWTSTKLPSPIKESPKKKAVLHVKSTPQDEESAEVRVIARIQPAETAEELPSSEEQSKARESTSSLFGFLKSAGRKRKSTSIESSTAVPYLAASERYEGPVDTVDRHDDLANLPLDHQPRVPYVSKLTKATTETTEERKEEVRPVRYIARIRHEGEEEIVEKDQVQPQLYGLPSTSYEGPLEDTSRQDDLELLPIEDHAKVYHSGQSWIKAKPPTPVKEHPEPKEAKKKAILHVKRTEAEEEKPQIRVLARIQPSEVNEETVREPSPGLFGFLKTTGRKTRTVSNESSTIAAYPSSSEAYQGPLDTVDRREDLARLPLEQQPRVPYVSSPTKPIKEVAPEPVEEVRNVRYIARIRHEGEEEIVEKDQVQPELYGLPSTSYEGPLEDTSRQDDLQHLPIQDHAEIYHSGQSWTSTKLPSPIKESPKKKAVLHVKSTPQDEESAEVRVIARIQPAETAEELPSSEEQSKARESTSSLFGFLKSAGRKRKSTSIESSTAVRYLAASERYEGPVDTVDRHDDLANLPLDHQPRVPYVSKLTKATTETTEERKEEVRPVRYIARIRHEGEEEIVEKDQVQPQLYGLPSTSYEGPLEDTSRQDDLELLPIEDHAKIYHSGQSWIKAKPPTPVKEHPEPKEAKKKAILHVKATEEEKPEPEIRILARIKPAEVVEVEPVLEKVPKAREPSAGLFGFLKSSGKKAKTTKDESKAALAYPSTSEPYEGPLDSTDRRDDLASLPLAHQPQIPYVSKSTQPIVADETAPMQGEEIGQVRYIARIRHEGEEETVEKDQVKPELYGLPSTSYEGPLEDTSRQDDLQHLPIQDHAEIYHSGQSWTSTKLPSPIKESPKKKAVLHVKSTPQDEESAEVRVIARIQPAETAEELPSSEEQSKARESTSSLFGFLKSAGRKRKSTSIESSTAVPYLAASERYEGPVDTVDRHDDLANLPLDHQPRVPYVSKLTKATTETTEERKEEVRPVRYIARIRHEGEEEIVEKDQVQPQLYGLPSTSYEGPLEDTSRQDDLELLPIEDHAKVYHSGQSWIKAKPPTPVKEHPEPKEAKKKAILHVKGTEAEEEKPQIRVLARIQPSEVNEETVREPSPGLFGFLKTTGRKTRTVSNESSTIAAYPSSSEAYQGPLDTVDRREDLARLPLEQQPRVPYVSSPTKPIKEVAPEPVEEVRNVRYIARIRHEGEEEIVEKDQVQPELYGLPSTSYEGPLEDTSRQDDLELLPIEDHAKIYHSGQSWIKAKPPTPVKEHPEPKEAKKKAILHVKATEEEKPEPEIRILARIKPAEVVEVEPVLEKVPKAREPSAGLFGFLKSSGKKAKTTEVSFEVGGRHFSSSDAYHTEGTTIDGQQWTEIRVERRVEVQLEPVFCLTGAGLGAVSEDEAGLIFTATPAPMAPDRRSFLSRLGFKSKKSKKSKGEHEADSSDSSSSDEEHRVKVVPVVEQTTPIEQQENSADHKLVRHETKEQSYRLSGQGRSSGFNPEQPSLSTTIAEAERLNQRSPRLEHAERTITVRALAPLPVSFEESGQPHTTVASWQETTLLPDNVTVEYDDKGNRITRTVKTSQVKHTVQKQTFQNYTVPDETDPSSTVERSREQMTPLGLSTHTGPVVDTKTRSVVYEASSPSQGGTESVGEFVSSKTVTSGNRTIETITYKTERDGIIETHVEHRVTIHSDLPIDHDAELSAAIAEATQMNPDMTVEKIEVRQETST